MSLKSRIGEKSGPYQELITQEKIDAFCKAIGVENTQVAPPTFMTIYRRGEFDLLQRLGIELKNVLHAEQEFFYDEPILPGHAIEFEAQLTQVLEKQSSRASLVFMVFETEIRVSGKRLGVSKSTIVIREKKQN